MATQDDLDTEGRHGFSEEAEQDWIDNSYKGVIEEPDLPPEIARDSEIYEAICTHKKDANAHHPSSGDIGTTDEIRFTPKAASTGPRGTMYFDSDDDHIYVATE